MYGRMKLSTGCDLFSARDRVRERRRRRASRAAASVGQQVDQVVVAARAADQQLARSRIVGWRVVQQRAQRGAGTARGSSSPAWTPRRACRGRRASSAGSRTSCSPAAACCGSSSSACDSDWFSSPIAPSRRVRVGDQVGERALAAPSAVTTCEVFMTKSSSAGWSRVQLARQRLARRRRAPGLKYFAACVGLGRRGPRTRSPKPWMSFAQALARRRGRAC